MSTLAYPPISHPYRILDGFDVHRSEKLIIAFVAVDTPQGPKIRMYRWQKRNDSWKIDLCRMSVEWWDWSAIPSKISKLQSRDLYDNMQSDLDLGVSEVCNLFGGNGIFLFSVALSDQALILRAVKLVLISQKDSMSKSINMSTKYVNTNCALTFTPGYKLT